VEPEFPPDAAVLKATIPSVLISQSLLPIVRVTQEPVAFVVVFLVSCEIEIAQEVLKPIIVSIPVLAYTPNDVPFIIPLVATCYTVA
jgi:hypothetical protein